MAYRIPTATQNPRVARSLPNRLPPAAASPFFSRPQPTPTPPRPRFPPPKPATRHLATTTPRPFLLSALSNLAPRGAPSSPGGQQQQQQQQPPSKTLRARRLLPYPPPQVYTLIADIDSYRHFLPHCTHSRVTRWTTTNPVPTTTQSNGQGQAKPTPSTSTTARLKHPCQADLTVGWGPFTQTYTSRVYCVPGQVVEAVSGAHASTSIPRDTLLAAGYADTDLGFLDLNNNNNNNSNDNKAGEAMGMEEGNGIFESLVTRWTVRPVPRPGSRSRLGQGQGNGNRGEVVEPEAGEDWTEVTLSVTFQFANPALGFAVGQVADDKVDEMVEAFEARARELYGPR
ncbi:hypothetical protein N658DRAFT_443807 [Parathielavia hyrcaniae]|uniref:Coenzyme Q-binding protein COQ10 START domain-containing protein n=1 Tax=Parathielavia hyrcaniae TaxID=113614 RepID=A0AAN6Q8A2_9PEZI|nr:hypothetical protein N658DRAFT_443807 [Parathielavia hyrcaniae]